MKPATILFVCTGNICRSPLAEAVAERALSEHFGTLDLSTVGLQVASSGTHGLTGQPATDEMRTVAAELKFDLSAHRATRLDRYIVDGSSIIYAMEDQQVSWVQSQFPGSRARLLGEATIDDPYGLNLSAYRRAAREIVTGVLLRVPEIVGLAG